MKITVLAVGKIKERFYTDAVSEYAKRLSRYCRLEIVEVADEKTPDGAGEAMERKIKEKEGERLLSHIKDNMYVIALAIEGKARSSEELSGRLDNLGLQGNSDIAFVIGGSLGLSPEVLQRADLRLCFGKPTFSHQIFRIMLLEQIYRCFKIINNEPYHK